MRLVIATLLALTVTPTFAACEHLRVTSDWGTETAAQAAYAACLQLELSRRSIEDQLRAQQRADHQLKLQLLEMEQRMRQQLATPILPPIVAAF